MTDNNIIELTPFRADLARSLNRRGERLLASADLAGEVAALEPLEAYYIVREIGLDHALPILKELSFEQLQACLDLDCWNRYDFAADSLDEWLAPFAAVDPETLAQAFLALEHELQVLFLGSIVTVYDPDTDQVPPEDEEQESVRAMTPDGFYLLELKPNPPLKIHPFALLDALYQYDLNATHRLMTEVRMDLPTQTEEEALHFRGGRMEDLGFASPSEATVLFSRPPASPPLPSLLSEPLDSAATRLPSVYAAPLLETTLLQRALSLIASPKNLSRMEQELIWTINSAIIAYGEKPRDIEHITAIVTRVRDTISLGLESLLSQEEPPCPPEDPAAAARGAGLLEVWSMTDLFRHGYAATLVLQEEVRQAMAEPGFAAWYNLPDTEQSDEPADRLERAFVAALLGVHPLHGGFDPGNAETVRAFSGLAEVAAARTRLQRIVDHFKERGDCWSESKP